MGSSSDDVGGLQQGVPVEITGVNREVKGTRFPVWEPRVRLFQSSLYFYKGHFGKFDHNISAMTNDNISGSLVASSDI